MKVCLHPSDFPKLKRSDRDWKEKRRLILKLHIEGISMRSIERTVGVSINTITKLLIDAGRVCADFHDMTVRNVNSTRVQCDEIWSFCYAKQENVPTAKAAPDRAGDVWTWTALDADSKLIISYLLGGRDSGYALEFLDDVAKRLANRVQLKTDGHKAYLYAVEEAFAGEVDYAQLVKIYCDAPAQDHDRKYSTTECIGTRKTDILGNPDPRYISTSFVERQYLTTRMSMRRFARLTNAFSKKLQNHVYSTAIYVVYYNWCRKHKSLSMTPAQKAGLTNEGTSTNRSIF